MPQLSHPQETISWNECRRHSRTYDFIFSIGAACSCTQMLRKAGLQLASFPLDWVTGQTLNDSVDLLINNFSGFLEKKDLVKVNDRSPAHKDVYKNLRTGIHFVHDFPFNSSLNQEFPAVQEKYRRRCQRLYEELGKAQRILLVFMERPNTSERHATIEEIINAWEKLSQLYPQKTLDLRYVSYEPDCKKREIRAEQLNEHIILLKAEYKDHTKQNNYSPDLSFCLQFVKDCRMFLPMAIRWQRFWPKMLLYLLPGGRLRKRFKRHFHIY